MGSTGVNLTAQRFYRGAHELTGGRSVQSNLLTQAVVFWKYLGLAVWPAKLNVAHHVPVAHGLGETRVWLGLAGLGLYAGAGLLCLLRRRFLLALALFWLPATLSPTSSIVPLNVVMSEHRLYLPLTLFLGLLAALAAAAAWPPDGRRLRSRPAFGVAAALVLAAWGLRSAHRNADYLEPERLWGKAVAAAPENVRARNYYGNALVDRGDYLGAREQYRAARALYPEHFDTLINLGEANLRVAVAGQDREAWQEGEKIFREVIDREPRHVLARLKLGRLLFERASKLGDRPGDLEAAAVEFRTVIDMARAPRFRDVRVWAWSRIATLEEHRGDLEAAAAAYRAILAEVPFHAAARARLAAVLARLTGGS
jgi:tetratricopeptide (TPR) repeat protein